MTISEFVAGLSDLSVAGVRRKYSQPPAVVNTGDMPLMYPRLPEGSGGTNTFSYSGTLRYMVCELVIVVQSLRLDSNAVNMRVTLELMDNLHTALTSVASDLCIDRWSLSGQADQANADTYNWLIVARIEASA